jgi:hypothetical protein
LVGACAEAAVKLNAEPAAIAAAPCMNSRLSSTESSFVADFFS